MYKEKEKKDNSVNNTLQIILGNDTTLQTLVCSFSNLQSTDQKENNDQTEQNQCHVTGMKVQPPCTSQDLSWHTINCYIFNEKQKKQTNLKYCISLIVWNAKKRLLQVTWYRRLYVRKPTRQSLVQLNELFILSKYFCRRLQRRRQKLANILP